MKNAYLTFVSMLVVAALTGSSSYGQKQKTGSSNDAFLSKAMEINQAEIDLGRMAQNKAENPRVRQFADMMVQDHTQALEKLRSQAGMSGGQVPLSKQHQELSDKLSKLSGSEFDTEYMKAMVAGHQQAVQTFEREAGTGTSSTTQRQKPGTGGATSDAAVAREMLPTLQKHLNDAEQIMQSMGGTSDTTK